jgi:hypothetical protein
MVWAFFPSWHPLHIKDYKERGRERKEREEAKEKEELILIFVVMVMTCKEKQKKCWVLSFEFVNKTLTSFL